MLRNQIQKTIYCLIPFIWNVGKTHLETTCGIEINYKWAQENLGKLWEYPKLECGNGWQLYEFTKIHWIVNFQWMNFKISKWYLKSFLKLKIWILLYKMWFHIIVYANPEKNVTKHASPVYTIFNMLLTFWTNVHKLFQDWKYCKIFIKKKGSIRA